jgi:hypothetical protein
MQIRIARELVGRCRSLTRTILRLDRELQARTGATARRLLMSWLWPTERRQAARRDQPDRTLPDRRAASYDTVVIVHRTAGSATSSGFGEQPPRLTGNQFVRV